MARGNEIVVASNPRGLFLEGFLTAGSGIKPGTCLMQDMSVALQGGRTGFKLYDRAADGDRPAGPLWVLLNEWLLGHPVTQSYASGDRIRAYCPVQGEELNMLVADVAGTADSHTAGELLEVKDGTGKLIAATGTPQQTPFLLQETITQPTADTLAWVIYGV